MLSLATAEPLLDIEHCGDYEVQGVMNECFYQAFQKADKALNIQWKITLSKIREWDSKWAAMLLQSQRAWISYRDAQCNLAAFETEGGTMQATSDYSCREDLTKQRTQWLRDYVEDR